MKTLPAEQLSAFLNEAKESGKYEFYYTELATGLRRGELLSLKWEDIDFENKVITVRRQIVHVKGETKESPLKTKNTYRTVAISTDVVDLLREKRTHDSGFSKYVFPSPNGGPQDPDSVRPMFLRILARAGLDELRFHDLRHTFATMAIRSGVDMKTLSEMMGHYSVAFTLDTYGHVMEDMKRDAADKVGGFLRDNA